MQSKHTAANMLALSWDPHCHSQLLLCLMGQWSVHWVHTL